MSVFSFFAYTKIFNLKRIESRKIIWAVFFASFLAKATDVLGSYIPNVRFVLLLLLAGIFAGIMTRIRVDIAITGYALAFGINYGFYLLAALSTFAISWLFPVVAESEIVIAFIIAPMQFALVFGLFSIRRMKKGMLFLREKGAGIAGIPISAIAFVAIVLVSNQNLSEEMRVISIVSAIVSVAGIIIWWRRGLTRLYRKNIMQRAMQELEEENAKLKESSKLMEELIHRDNKLLVAMLDCEATEHSERMKLQGEIVALVQDRMATINKAQQVYKTLPKTSDALFDGVMQSMLARANERDILFDFILFDDISALPETITPIDLSTLLSELLENAIIATSYKTYRRILVSFGFRDGCHELCVQDSGIPFEEATLEKLGKERASTHLDDGGSGIGYMTIFEILRAHDISLIISQERSEKRFRLTKAVTVRFDGKGEYIVNTPSE